MDIAIGKRSLTRMQSAEAQIQSPDEAYEQLVRDYAPALSRLATAYEADLARRDDLLQDIHINLWRSLSAFKGDCSLRTWIYRIAHNTAATHVLREQRHQKRILCSLDDLHDYPDAADEERSIDEAGVIGKLHGLIRQLKPFDRQIIVLHLEGLKPAEISTITGLSPGNVATKIHRLRDVLARHFSVEIHHDRSGT